MGGSLGATTVLMTSGFDLPEQVHGIVADCGFVSPEEQIGQTLKDWWHLPRQPFLWIADHIARRKAGFSFWEYSTLKAMETNTKPILFVHGLVGRKRICCWWKALGICRVICWRRRSIKSG